MAKTPNRLKDGDEFSTFNNGEFIRKKSDGTGLESAAAGGSLTIEEEGVSQGTATTLDFVGATVTAAVTGGEATITIAAAPVSHSHDANQITTGTLNADRIGVTTIAYAKIQDVTQGARLLGRASGAGQGAITELDATQVNAITLGVTGPTSAVVDNLATYTSTTGKAIGDSSVSIASVNTAISHAGVVTGNPHHIAIGDLEDGSFAELQEKLTDFQILLSTAADELDSLTYDSTPGTTDRILLEDGTTGAKKYTTVDDLPAGAEANDLEILCTNIAANEVPIGTAANTVTYTTVGTNTVLCRKAGNIVAETITTALIADDQVTLAKIATKTDTNPGVLGYDADGNPVEIEEGSSGQVLISGGATAAPAFGTLGTSAFADNTISYQRLLNGTAGQLITWVAGGAAGVVATGTAGHVLTSAGAGAAPTFTNVRGSKSFSVETPTGTDLIPLWITDRAITITAFKHQCWGSTNVIWRLYQGTGQGTGGTAIHGSDITSTTTLTSTTASGGDLSVPVDNCIWYDATSISGTPTNLVITVYYTED